MAELYNTLTGGAAASSLSAAPGPDFSTKHRHSVIWNNTVDGEPNNNWRDLLAHREPTGRTGTTSLAVEFIAATIGKRCGLVTIEAVVLEPASQTAFH